MLQALEIPLPSQLLAHAHWTVQQKKMSKSVGNVADPFDTVKEFGVDVVRWYLGRVGGRFRDDVGELPVYEYHSKDYDRLTVPSRLVTRTVVQI